jgi:hypothetical protein
VAEGASVTAPEYLYPSGTSTQVPDRTDVSLLADLRRQVAQQLAAPIGSRPMVAELDVGHGDLVNDDAAQATIGAAADQLHSQAHGE